MTATGASRSRSRHLSAVPDLIPGQIAAPAADTSAPTMILAAGPDPAWSRRRPGLLRVCAGEPLRLGDEEIGLISLANQAEELRELLLDADADPDDYAPAEVAVEYFVLRYGTQRHAKGDRVKGVESTYRRYLLPFLVELAASRPAGQRGVASLRITQLETLPLVVAGDARLPAATVAAELLGRIGIGCIYLSLKEAATVTVGGARALDVARAAGDVTAEVDVRTGEPIIAAAALRRAKILIERTTGHGLQTSSAGNVLRDLRQTLERARGHGARVRGSFALSPVEPLRDCRLRPKPAPRSQVELATIAAVCAQMPVTGQVVLWIARLVGLRLSEVFGLHVHDYVRDAHDRPWLVIAKQGGKSSLGRDPKTGKLRGQHEKGHTKTQAGARTVPIPVALAGLLDTLVEVFHTDPDTGAVNWPARLIPGLRSEDRSGQSSFRTWLHTAQADTGVCFRPHDLRAALITDLMDAGVDTRLTHYYAGHERTGATVQDKSYDLGPYAALLHPIADLLDERIETHLDRGELRVETPVRELWGSQTTWARRAGDIDTRLVDCRWRRAVNGAAGPDRLLSPPAVASRIGKSLSYTRRLMSDGTIAAHTRRRGERDVWLAYASDVDRYVDQRSGPTVAEVAAELGWTYHQVWQTLRDQNCSQPGRPAGTSIRLNADTVEALREEAARRDGLAAASVTVREAAALLAMEVAGVETLIRQGCLVPAPGSHPARRYLTRRSVQDFNQGFPAPAPQDGDSSSGGDLLTFGETCRLLGLSRPQLSALIATRQVRTERRRGSRHVYITVASAAGWTQRQTPL